MADKTRYVGGLSPEFALLGFLHEGPSHGYELYQRLSTELGYIWHISQSQLYNILKRLTAQGLIVSTRVEQEKLPPRQRLQITPAGQQRFQNWLYAPTGSSVRAMRLEFITRLYFIQKCTPDKLANLLTEQATEISQSIAWLETLLENTPDEQVFNRLGLELRLKQLQSLLEWLADCQKKFLQN